MIFIDVHPDYKRTSLAKYVKVFDRFLEGLARSRKGEMLKKSGEFMNISVSIGLNYFRVSLCYSLQLYTYS